MAEAKTHQLGAALLLIPFIFLASGAEAASFQRNQLLQREPDPRSENGQKLPNPDMIKALEYIEKLRQQAHKEESSPDYNPYQGLSVPLQQKESSDDGHLPESSRDSLSEDDWMRIILEALRQAENEPQSAPKENKPYALNLMDMSDDYETQQWPERKLKHMRFPLMYEDNSRDNPFKRTNEIVEEQYTPQSLATLESVFQELGKLTGPNGQKREKVDEEQKLYTDDEDDVYKANNIAYEDVVGGEDWNPVEEKIESQTQEEVRDSKENIEKNEQITDEMKRSGQLPLQDEDLQKESKDQLSDDVSKVIAYLKRLVKAVGSGRSLNGLNGDRATRLFEKPLDSQSIYQLIEISRNLQIPPEDLIDMIKTGEKPSASAEPEQELDLPADLDDISEADLDHPDLFQNKLLSKSGYPKTPGRAGLEALPDGLSVEDILNLLGMDGAANQKPPYFPNPYNQEKVLPRLPYGPGKSRANQLPKATWMSDVENKPMAYENLNDKDQELGEYLARMLVKYPEIINSNQVKRLPGQGSAEDDLQEEDRVEKTIKEASNQGSSQESDKLAPVSKRLPVGPPKNDDSPNRQYLDEDLLMKVLEYLNQEKAEKGKEHLAKRAMENM
ncbi:secretogranin-2 [Otolemur garnettii]|uniref:Secretogranin-2 n=1 Tax=Otolemur garnettii TaxID=30611 RepID=H0XUE5_OTOGA|nr:secretogranin-2 [Otolemur garnettii]